MATDISAFNLPSHRDNFETFFLLFVIIVVASQFAIFWEQVIGKGSDLQHFDQCAREALLKGLITGKVQFVFSAQKLKDDMFKVNILFDPVIKNNFYSFIFTREHVWI